MTKVKAHAGVCGFETFIEAVKKGRFEVQLTLTTDCDAIQKMAGSLNTLTIKDVYSKNFGENLVYATASNCVKHAACPVPSAILKAAEAEMGLALKRPVKIEFIE